MTDLETLFELSTDKIESPNLARTALATARRRRTRRRGIVAAATAGVAVAGAVVVPQLVDRPVDRTPPTEQPTSTPSTPDDESLGIAPPIDPDVIQAVWDPTTVVDLTTYPIGGLPQPLEPFASSFAGDGPGLTA